MQAKKSNLFMVMWINKLQPMGALASAGQMGQHSPDGMIRLAHSLISSQIISSQSTAPLSHTQIRHGSGFHTSLSLYCWPSWMQPPASTVVTSRGCVAGEQRRSKSNGMKGRLVQERVRKSKAGCELIQRMLYNSGGREGSDNSRVWGVRGGGGVRAV